MTADNGEKPKKRNAWNPFQPLRDAQEIHSAANSGRLVTGYLAITYLFQIGFVYFSGKDTFGDRGAATLPADILGFLLAVFLFWRIWVKQPFWATLFAAIWLAVEIFMKFAAIFAGQQQTNVGWVIMFAALAGAAILSVRGSWQLRNLRKSEPLQP